jgi:chorismate dehydratase
LIGDRGIHPAPEQFAVSWDLGEEWYEWTGLPFVFAMWATRTGTMLGEVEDALCRARDLGIERIEQIAGREAPLLGIPERHALDYLTNNLDYRLGSAEKAGLSLFCRLAAELGLAPEGVDIVYRNCATAGKSG